MKQIRLLLLSSLIAGGCLSAQTLTSTTISTNPSGPVFYVDGAGYTAPQTFQWPVGSKHIVQYLLSTDPSGNATNYQSAQFDNVRYIFNGWTDNLGLLAPASQPVLTISADPTITSFVATVTVNYHVEINFGGSISALTCPGAAPGNPSPASGLVYGIVYFDGGCIASTTDFYLPAGSHNLNAFPYPGWVFYGWNINGNPSSAFLSSTYDIESPTILYPLFSIAKRVNFTTNPMGLNVLIDRTPVPTPPTGTDTQNGTCSPDFTRLPPLAPVGFTPLCLGQFDFLPGSKHQLGSPTPQMDQFGNYWVFGGFSDGLGQNSTYTADYNTNAPDNVVANFNPGVHASVFTNPVGMKLQIDTQTVTAPYNVIWAAGDSHQVGAPAQQNDSQGRAWVFANWSNAGAATQTITVPATGLALAANYTLLGQVQVTSVPVGLTFTVDGNTCVTPCVVNKSNGAQFQVTIPPSIASTTTSRLDFVSWSDGNTSASRQVSITQNTLTLTASYQTSYLLTAISNPANSATFKYSPATPGGFFPAGTNVSVTVTANNGYKFLHWEGDLTGAFATGTLTMISPHSVQADTQSVPFIPTAGIQTAAGPTPDGSVAAGSIIAIYGQSLAPALQVGPANPLSQSIGGVSADVNGQLFPLLFVSPAQIAAQVPWELQPGSYTLTVHSVGQADVTGTFTVSRDAPAIFTLPATDPTVQPLALALHQDGTVITAASPARPNEEISIYGTGFGPYSDQIPDGFQPPSTETYKVVDPVTVTIGGVQVTPDSTTAAPGMVGMTIVKVKITSALPSATTANLTVTAGVKTSSPVSLPLQ